MAKSADAFRTISEVADWLDTPAHVLRFWESKFPQIKPVKRAGGRRYYRPADMELIGGIKKLLHDDGMTIKGVQKVLRDQGVRYVSDLAPALDEPVADTEGSVQAGSDTSVEADDTASAQVIDWAATPHDGADTSPGATHPPAAEAEPSRPGLTPDPDAADAPQTATEDGPGMPSGPTEFPVDTEADPAAEERSPAIEAPSLPSFLTRPAQTTRPSATEGTVPPAESAEPVDPAPGSADMSTETTAPVDTAPAMMPPIDPDRAGAEPSAAEDAPTDTPPTDTDTDTADTETAAPVSALPAFLRRPMADRLGDDAMSTTTPAAASPVEEETAGVERAPAPPEPDPEPEPEPPVGPLGADIPPDPQMHDIDAMPGLLSRAIGKRLADRGPAAELLDRLRDVANGPR